MSPPPSGPIIGSSASATVIEPADRWLPWRAELAELARPWKLATFAIAMALLLFGALYMHVGDWDVGVTLLMGTLTYATAPTVVRTNCRRTRSTGSSRSRSTDRSGAASTRCRT